MGELTEAAFGFFEVVDCDGEEDVAVPEDDAPEVVLGCEALLEGSGG